MQIILYLSTFIKSRYLENCSFYNCFYNMLRIPVILLRQKKRNKKTSSMHATSIANGIDCIPHGCNVNFDKLREKLIN